MVGFSNDSASLARAAARLRSVLSALVLFLALALLVERLGYAWMYRGTAPPAGLLAALARQCVFATPAAAYLLALWQLRQVAALVASGAPFEAAIVRALRRLGFCLIGGAALSLAMPTLHHLLGQAYPRLIEMDVATLTIGGIGLGLTFLARLVDRAGAVQSELDEIF
jgi:hypothetical protein